MPCAAFAVAVAPGVDGEHAQQGEARVARESRGIVLAARGPVAARQLAPRGDPLRTERPRQVRADVAQVLFGIPAVRPLPVEEAELDRVGCFKYEPVQLELMGRKENFDVIEVPESVPNRLGQVPLAVLDLVVDTKRRKLIPNPAHGGEQTTEEY